MTPTVDEPVTDDTARIVSGLVRGERAAWEALYERYSVAIWRYVARISGADAHDVAEVVQEVFLSAAKSARNFDPSRGSLWNWLAGVAHHESLRRNGRIRRIARDAAEQDRRSPHADQDPPALLERVENVESVRAVLSELSPEYSALLIAKYMDGLEVREIQELHGGSFEGVRSKLARARTEFRAAYERLRTP